MGYGKESFLCEIPNATKNDLKSRLCLLQQDGGKCSIPSIMANFVLFLCMQKHLPLAIVYCLGAHSNLSLAGLIRDGLIRSRNLLALTR